MPWPPKVASSLSNKMLYKFLISSRKMQQGILSTILGCCGCDYVECRVNLVRTDVLEEHSASIIRVTRILELGKLLAVTRNIRKKSTRHNLRITQPIVM
jgi:hypothetical protein